MPTWLTSMLSTVSGLTVVKMFFGGVSSVLICVFLLALALAALLMFDVFTLGNAASMWYRVLWMLDKLLLIAGVEVPSASWFFSRPLVVAMMGAAKWLDTWLPLSEAISALHFMLFFLPVMGGLRIVLVVYSLIPAFGRNT